MSKCREAQPKDTQNMSNEKSHWRHTEAENTQPAAPLVAARLALGLDFIALSQAMADCTPQGKRQAAELRERICKRLAGPCNALALAI
jgi:hypothetical protein